MGTIPGNGTLIAISKNNVLAKLNVIKEKIVGDDSEFQNIVDLDSFRENGNVVEMFDQKTDGEGDEQKEIHSSKSETLGSNNNVKIKIDSVNTDFAPVLKDLKVEYSIDKESMDKIKSYTNQKVEFKIVITDVDSKIIHIDSKKLTEEDKYIWIWNGITQEKKTIDLDLEPYSIILALAVGKVEIKSIGDIKLGVTEDNNRIVAIDKKELTIDPRFKEWESKEYRNTRGYIGNFNTYKDLYENFMQYETVQLAGNPLNFLKQNIVWTSFLGIGVNVHRELADVLEEVERILKDKGIFYILVDKYKTVPKKYPKIQSLSVRKINNTNTLSNHSFGLAIDIYPQKNPVIYSYEKLVIFFIKKSTGFDLITKEAKNREEVKEAHNKLVSLYAGLTNDDLQNKYTDIQDYIDNPLTFKLENLQKLELYLHELLDNSKPRSEYEIREILETVSIIIDKLNKLSSNLELYIDTVVFTPVSKNAIRGLQSRIESLNSINKMLRRRNQLSFLERDWWYYHSSIQTVIKEINNFQKDIQQFKKEYKDLREFGKALTKAIKSMQNDNVLLDDGFSDVEIEIIEAFEESVKEINKRKKKEGKKEVKFEWGGNYKTKMDAMHFELINVISK